jgi:hypothetical protein
MQTFIYFPNIFKPDIAFMWRFVEEYFDFNRCHIIDNFFSNPKTYAL